MGLAFIHNPDWLATADLHYVFDDVAADAVVTASGYAGTAGLTGSDAGLVRKVVALDEWELFCLGCRLKVISVPATPRVVLGITDPSLIIHCCVMLQTDGTLAIYRGTSDGPLAWGVSPPLSLGTWVRLGFQGKLAAIQGRADLVIDDETIQVDSIPTLADDATGIQGGIAIGVAPEFITGHYYLVDTATTGRSSLLSDLLVKVQRPTTIGTFNDYTPTGAASVPSALDDATPDGDTTTADTGESEGRFTTILGPSLSTSITRVYAARATALAKVVDTGEGTTHSRLRILQCVNGGAYPSALRVSLGTAAYTAVTDMLQTNPVYENPWTAATMNAAQAGVQQDG